MTHRAVVTGHARAELDHLRAAEPVLDISARSVIDADSKTNSGPSCHSYRSTQSFNTFADTTVHFLAGHPRLAKANMIAGLKSRNLEKAFGQENL